MHADRYRAATSVLSLVTALGTAACIASSAPAAPPLPTTPPTVAEQLDRAIHRAGVIYWNRGTACAAWRLEHDPDVKSGRRRERLVNEIVADGWRHRSSYGYAARANQVSLAGPYRYTERDPPDDGESTLRVTYCVAQLSVRQVTTDHVDVGAFRWYFTRAACERDTASRPVLATICAGDGDASDEAPRDAGSLVSPGGVAAAAAPESSHLSP